MFRLLLRASDLTSDFVDLLDLPSLIVVSSSKRESAAADDVIELAQLEI